MQIKNEPQFKPEAIKSPEDKKPQEKPSIKEKITQKPTTKQPIKKPDFSQLNKKGLAGTQHQNSQTKKQIKEVENILSENLKDFFLSLSDTDKQRFKTTGEQTAIQIQKLLTASQIKVKKIISLIKKWLKILPGVNKHYIEQASKIKTDKLLKNKSNW